jgi:hypothetical protein
MSSQNSELFVEIGNLSNLDDRGQLFSKRSVVFAAADN